MTFHYFAHVTIGHRIIKYGSYDSYHVICAFAFHYFSLLCGGVCASQSVALNCALLFMTFHYFSHVTIGHRILNMDRTIRITSFAHDFSLLCARHNRSPYIKYGLYDSYHVTCALLFMTFRYFAGVRASQWVTATTA